MTTVVLKIESWRQRIFWLLLLALFGLLAIYIYFVNGLIFGVASRTALIREQASLDLEISQLEGRYLALADTVTIKLAHDLGFEEAGINSSFITQRTTPFLAMDTSSGHDQ